MSTATWSPSLMRPIATPATGARIGTPASMSDRVPPQTVAMELDPFDSVISLTMRTVYGNWSWVGITRARARSARLPWPTSRRPGVRRGFTSPTE